MTQPDSDVVVLRKFWDKFIAREGVKGAKIRDSSLNNKREGRHDYNIQTSRHSAD